MSVQKYDSQNKILKLIAGGTLWADCPLGTINAFGGSTAPEGWLLCQGQAISRTDYADLFAVIGTNFGAGDGSTTFNLPDMKGKVLAGYNANETEFNALGKTGGEKTHTLTKSEMPAHNHRITPLNRTQNSTEAGGYGVTAWQQAGASFNLYSETIGGGTAHNNLQPYETVNFIIKAVQIPMPADLKAALEAALDEKDILTWG